MLDLLFYFISIFALLYLFVLLLVVGLIVYVFNFILCDSSLFFSMNKCIPNHTETVNLKP